MRILGPVTGAALISAPARGRKSAFQQEVRGNQAYHGEIGREATAYFEQREATPGAYDGDSAASGKVTGGWMGIIPRTRASRYGAPAVCAEPATPNQIPVVPSGVGPEMTAPASSSITIGTVVAPAAAAFGSDTCDSRFPA